MTRNPDRLVLFTDAVVAIAVTLLILPLVEVVTESRGEGLDAQAVITDHQAQIFGFLLSFVVISRFWLTHHKMFEHVKAYNSRLVQLNMLWLLTIVVMPFPTEIVGTYPSTKFTAGLYIGNLLALSIVQLALTLLIRNHQELEQEANPITRREVIGAAIFTILAAVSFLLAAFVPGVKFYALLLLILTGFDGVVDRLTKNLFTKNAS
ncbi:TMEM175 family protein [Streptomyces sp. SID13031]|uniref:TMEM175 family protein n=1 Tax=Streptomyces sp. SID13031 TaxID=2706046 RepID=UPI001EF26556|nr:TMEM175 family protein [Streptomyces sp. SID13031]